jgi:hypothetical protein
LQCNFYLETTVDLVSFEAQSRRSKIELHWVTKKEKNNLGFFLLRSERASGPFRTVNENVIASQSSGKYLYVDENVTAGTTVFYKLKDVDRDGRCSEHGPISIMVPIPSSIDLTQNYPNPFNPTTEICYHVPRKEHVKLVIYNLMGHKVRVLLDDNVKPGQYSVVWNSLDENSLQVPTGIYIYRMQAGSFKATKKLLFVK